jgi:hypothetical protein
MNFTFVTLLLLLISLPGVVIRRSYYASHFSINYMSTNLVNELIWSFTSAIFLNAFAISIIERTTKFWFRLDYLGYLVPGKKNLNKKIVYKLFNYCLISN